MNILIVDDDQAYRLLLGDYIKGLGWTVYAAANGEEGLEKMEKAKMDIIISDVYMPVMDGIKFHQKVRQHPRYNNIPFLFVSAYDDEHTRSATKSSKLDAFFKKANPVSELKAWIEFLTTPVEKRKGLSPYDTSKAGPQLHHRDNNQSRSM